jgi:hypothetical protein
LSNLSLGRELKEEEKHELIAAATYMHIKKEELARQFINQDRCNYIITISVTCMVHVHVSAMICLTTQTVTGAGVEPH